MEDLTTTVYHDQEMASIEGRKRKASNSMMELDPLSILTGPYRMRAPKPFDITNCTKQDILDFFEDSYSLSESLFTALRTEDAFYMCPDRLRLPLIFYYAHTASVYVNKLLQAEFIQSRVNNHFETLFETGVNENKWDNVENNRMGGSFVWPPLKEVVEFRKQVRELVREKIFHSTLQLPITQDNPWWGLLMVMDHDAVHTETSSVLIRQLPIHQVRLVEGWRKGPLTAGEPVEQNPMIPVSARTVKFGKPRDFPTFGWDIDYSEIHMSVPKFEASKYLITNKEYLEFVDCGGYNNKEVWTEEGWGWKENRQPNHPLFWLCNKGCKSGCGGTLSTYSHCTTHNTDGSKRPHDVGRHIPEGKDKFRFRTMCEEIDMPWDWPVEINFHEAKAYCNWLGADYRLLTEAEYHAVRDFPPVKSMDIHLDNIMDPSLNQKYNINLNFMTSTPVNMFPPNKLGFHDAMGNVWCLLEDHSNGLPGWESHMLYDDYARTYFDSKHNILLGGSWVTNGYEASRFVRWWFRRHFHQHAGFRVVKMVDKSQNPPVRYVKPIENIEDVEIPLYVKDPATIWTEPKNGQFQQETPESVVLRLSHEYGDHNGHNFYKGLSDLCKQLVDKYKVSSLRMLDVGSGCGRVSFEMARQFKEVVGVDYCNNYIGASFSVLKKGNLEFVQPIIGNALEGSTAVQNTISNIHNEGDFNSLTFKQFTWLPNELSNFDLVLHQLIDRAVNKKAWCLRLWELIHEKGLVVFTSFEISDLETIQQLIGPRLRWLETHHIPLTDTNGPVNAMITVWCRA